MRENEVCELLKSAYGLVNAPYLWYQELKECLQELHFSMSPLDPCLFVLTDSNGFVHGALGVHVDDGLCAGDHFFLQTLEKLEKRFPFGSKRSGDFTFTGIHVCQDEQYNSHLDQRDYVMNIEPIRIDRSRRKLEQAEVTEEERQGLRGLIGSLQYAALNTRPDVSARLSLLQSRINCARIIDLLEANRLLGDAKRAARKGRHGLKQDGQRNRASCRSTAERETCSLCGLKCGLVFSRMSRVSDISGNGQSGHEDLQLKSVLTNDSEPI
eukprot:s5018_g2.t1